MPKNRLVEQIRDLLKGDYGFDVYIAMKNDSQAIKRFVLDEGSPTKQNGFKKRLHNSIVDTIHTKYLSEESQYVTADALGNEQNRLYLIS